MIKPGNVPKEAIAELRAFLNACDCDDCVSVAIAAALSSWPGMEPAILMSNDDWTTLPGSRVDGIILPLPQETRDDER